MITANAKKKPYVPSLTASANPRSDQDHPDPSHLVVSMGSIALVVQVFLIYVSAYFHKSGPGWKDGTLPTSCLLLLPF